MTASRRAGPCSLSGAASSRKPPAALAAEPANTYGISRCAACQTGTEVSHSRTAVYVVTAGPSRAAAAVAGGPSTVAAVLAAEMAGRLDFPPDGSSPARLVTAAAPAIGP